MSWLSMKRACQRRTFLGCCDVIEYLESDLIEKYGIILDTNANSAIGFKKNTDLIFNQIAEADTNQKTLAKVDSLLKQIAIPCINHPKYVMQTTREMVSQKLQGIENLIMPLTIRIAPISPDQIIEAIEASGLEFPVIIRDCGVHGGETTFLLSNTDEVRQLYALALDGSDHYLTQYYEYKEDGVYKKYRLVVIDGQAFIRSLFIGNHWMLHRNRAQDFMENHPQYDQEEVNTLKNFDFSLRERIEPIMREIHQRIPLDYFGIDCNFNKQGQICLFEANATMNIFINPFPRPNRWEEPIEKIKNAIIEMLVKKHKKQDL